MAVSSINSNQPSQSTIVNDSPASTVIGEFKQLSQDLQSGNLSQAQADYATLVQNAPAGIQDTTTPSGDAFTQLGQALQSGNLSAAKQALSTVTHHMGRHHFHAVPQQSTGSTTGQDSSASTESSSTSLDGTGTVLNVSA